MSLDSCLSIASSGISAVNAELALVSQNVANAGTAVLLLDILPKNGDNRNAVAEGAVARALVTHPRLTIKVVVGIGWEARRLWLTRVPGHAHPGVAPATPVTAVVPPGPVVTRHTPSPLVAFA